MKKNDGIVKTSKSANSSPEAWSQIDGQHSIVYGGLLQQGFVIEFRDFSTPLPFEWGRTFQTDCLQICLNLHGDTDYYQQGKKLKVGDNRVAICAVGKNRPRAVRSNIGHHCFYTLTFTRQWLFQNLNKSIEHLRPDVREYIEGQGSEKRYLNQMPLPIPLIPLRIDLLAPPVDSTARETWYFGKTFEILSLVLFRQPEAKNATDARNQQRADCARSLIEQDYRGKISLKALGKAAKCSPFHLSRIFKSVHGISISEFHMAIRMEKAAEFLRGGMSVTDASATVGYSNISAFIKAFSGYHQTTPARWVSLFRKRNQEQAES